LFQARLVGKKELRGLAIAVEGKTESDYDR
jgi:hypothetical protein